MNYILFFNSYKNMLQLNFFYNLFKTIAILFISFNVPEYIFSKITNIGNIPLIDSVTHNIYTFGYKIPSFIVLYTLIGNRIIKQIDIISRKNTINPSHLYVFFLINISYLFLTIFQSGFSLYKVVAAFFDLTTYALYFSEFGYAYIDNEKLNYNNFVDFFNNNIGFFSIISMCYVLINTFIINSQFYLIGLYLYSVFISPFLLSYRYNKYNSTAVNYYNFFYPFEKVLSFFVSLFSLILLDKLTKRNIQIK